MWLTFKLTSHSSLCHRSAAKIDPQKRLCQYSVGERSEQEKEGGTDYVNVNVVYLIFFFLYQERRPSYPFLRNQTLFKKYVNLLLQVFNIWE